MRAQSVVAYVRRVWVGVLFAALFLPLQVNAEEASPSDQKVVGGFQVVALLVAMSSEEFTRLWETPRDQGVLFDLASEVQAGAPVQLAVFFSGAKEVAGEIQLHCKSEFVFPDLSRQVIVDRACKKGKLSGPSTDLYLAGRAGIDAPTALAGENLVVEHVITDMNAGISVSLRVSIRIIAPGAGS